MANYKENIIPIDLAKSGVNFSCDVVIGSGDDDADRIGVLVFRDGEPVNLSGTTCQGIFHNSHNENIALTSYGYVSNNLAYITLPPACYNYDGSFVLAIKLVGGGETVTVRVISGFVQNTNTNGTIAPTGSVPTYQEVLSTYEQAIAALSGAVYADHSQSLTTAQQAQARSNISAQKDITVELIVDSDYRAIIA